MRLLYISTGLITIFLLIFYWTDLQTSENTFEFLFIIGFLFFLTLISISWFQKPVSKGKEKVRIKRYNWNYLIAWSSLGITSVLMGAVFNGFETLIFGYLNGYSAVGILFIMEGIYFFITVIKVDKSGINTGTSFMNKISLNELDSFSLSNERIIFNTDSDKYEYKIFKLSDKDKGSIITAINKIQENYVA